MRFIYGICLFLFLTYKTYSQDLRDYSLADSLFSYKEDTTKVDYIKGLDVSKYQGLINWDTMATRGYKFVFIKASQGITIKDVYFDYNWKHSEGKMIRGAYHFFSPHINGITQAKYFLSIVSLKPGDLPPVVDVEYTSLYKKVHPYTAYKNLKLFIEYVEKVTGVKPIIYTNCNFWNRQFHPYFKGDESKYTLWLARYTNEKDPIIPKGFTKWTFWQYTDRGRISGFSPYFDQNYYRGDNINDLLIK